MARSTDNPLPQPPSTCARIPHCRQLGQPHPVGEPARHRAGRLTGQPGLAYTRPGHRRQSALTQQSRDLVHRGGPAGATRPHGCETMHLCGKPGGGCEDARLDWPGAAVGPDAAPGTAECAGADPCRCAGCGGVLGRRPPRPTGPAGPPRPLLRAPPPRPPAPQQAPVTIAAVGDTMLGNTPDLPPVPGEVSRRGQAELNRGAQIVFGNLEGTLTTATAQQMRVDARPGRGRVSRSVTRRVMCVTSSTPGSPS